MHIPFLIAMSRIQLHVLDSLDFHWYIGNWLRPYTTCKNREDGYSGFFGYAEDLTGQNCACYLASEECPDDDSNPEYTSYVIPTGNLNTSYFTSYVNR